MGHAWGLNGAQVGHGRDCVAGVGLSTDGVGAGAKAKEVDLGEKSRKPWSTAPASSSSAEVSRTGTGLNAKVAAATPNSSPHEEFAERAARSSAMSYTPCRYARRWPERLPDEQARRSLSNAARRPRLMVVCVLHRGLAL
jgi:hypothetical protein